MKDSVNYIYFLFYNETKQIWNFIIYKRCNSISNVVVLQHR